MDALIRPQEEQSGQDPIGHTQLSTGTAPAPRPCRSDIRLHSIPNQVESKHLGDMESLFFPSLFLFSLSLFLLPDSSDQRPRFFWFFPPKKEGSEEKKNKTTNEAEGPAS